MFPNVLDLRLAHPLGFTFTKCKSVLEGSTQMSNTVSSFTYRINYFTCINQYNEKDAVYISGIHNLLYQSLSKYMGSLEFINYLRINSS